MGAVHSSLIDHRNDIVVTKQRVNAFAGTDLDVILRAKDVITLVLFGITTSGVVLSTLLHACGLHSGFGGRSVACVTRSVGALPM